MPNNSTVDVAIRVTDNTSTNLSGDVIFADGGPVTVEQGPRWLAALAYNPPEWMGLAIPAIMLGVLVLAALGVYRSGFTLEVAGEMAENATIGVCVIIVTNLVVGAVEWPYVADVTVGALGGFLLAKASILVVRRYFGDRIRVELRNTPTAK